MKKSETNKNSAWCRAWYRKNKAKKYEMQKRRRREIQRRLDAIKATAGCLRCTESDPVCLTFHHRNPETKVFDIAIARNGGIGWERILGELAKCVVLCANCHHKHHWEERNRAKVRC